MDKLIKKGVDVKMDIKQINEIRKAINTLNSIDWCLKNTNIKRTKNFLFSIKNQYLEKGTLSDKQLEEANKSRANLEKLLDQQQQLTLVSNKKIESLRLELEEKESEKQIDEEITKEEIKANEKKKWWQFFK